MDVQVNPPPASLTPLQPPTQEQVRAVVTTLAQDALQAEKDLTALIAAYKSKGAAGVASLLPALAPELQQDWKDVQAALPVVKAGYKTTEFWIVAGVTLGLFVLSASGKVPAIDAGSLISALAGVYTVVRSLAKKPAATP